MYDGQIVCLDAILSADTASLCVERRHPAPRQTFAAREEDTRSGAMCFEDDVEQHRADAPHIDSPRVLARTLRMIHTGSSLRVHSSDWLAVASSCPSLVPNTVRYVFIFVGYACAVALRPKTHDFGHAQRVLWRKHNIYWHFVQIIMSEINCAPRRIVSFRFKYLIIAGASVLARGLSLAAG